MSHPRLSSYTSSSEQDQLAHAEKASADAFAEWKKAERQGHQSQDRIEELKARAMEKDEILRSLQDLCD